MHVKLFWRHQLLCFKLDLWWQSIQMRCGVPNWWQALPTWWWSSNPFLMVLHLMLFVHNVMRSRRLCMHVVQTWSSFMATFSRGTHRIRNHNRRTQEREAGPLPYTVPGADRKFPASHQLLSQWWLAALEDIIKYFFASSVGSDECPRTRRPNNLGSTEIGGFCRGKIGSPFHCSVYWPCRHWNKRSKTWSVMVGMLDESWWFRSRSCRHHWSSTYSHGETVPQ